MWATDVASGTSSFQHGPKVPLEVTSLGYLDARHAEFLACFKGAYRLQGKDSTNVVRSRPLSLQYKPTSWALKILRAPFFTRQRVKN